MKIICDCENEMEFNNMDEDTGKQAETTEEGQYATIDYSKFMFWETHDVVGIVCEKCDKAIWLFT